MKRVDSLQVPGLILLSVGGNQAVPHGPGEQGSEGHQALGSVALKFTVGLCGADFRSGMAEGTG